MKRIKILLLSILMIFNIDKVDALGSNTVDFNEKGSIEITLFEKNDNRKLKLKDFNDFYRVYIFIVINN